MKHIIFIILLRAIASEMRLEGRRVHVVWPVGAKVLGFPLEYRNEACGIYQVTP